MGMGMGGEAPRKHPRGRRQGWGWGAIPQWNR